MTINEMLEMIENNYDIVELRDSYDGEPVSTLFLNKKHSIGEFQDAIDKAKEKHAKDIYLYGNDWEYIEQELDMFDYELIGFDDARYFVEY